MSTRTRLELTWIGKENRPKLEPRILLEDPSLSHHAAKRVSEGEIFDNSPQLPDGLSSSSECMTRNHRPDASEAAWTN